MSEPGSAAENEDQREEKNGRCKRVEKAWGFHRGKYSKAEKSLCNETREITGRVHIQRAMNTLKEGASGKHTTSTMNRETTPTGLAENNPGERAAQSTPQWLRPGAWPDEVIILLLMVLAVLCYVNTLGNSFVYDDSQQILRNPYVKSWHYLPQIFGSTVWSFVGAAGMTNYYRPLMTFSYLVLWQIFGELPFGFHLFNVVLNAAVVIMVFRAGQALFQDRRIASLSAVLFAVHPVHTETASWIAGVPDLEATLFLLLAFWLFAETNENNWRRQAAIAGSFALALLSKEPALMLAPLVVVFEHFVRRGNERVSFKRKIVRYAPLCLMAPAYLLLRIALFGRMAPVLQHPKITWPEAIYSAFALVAGYAKYLFWPAPLSAFHVFHASSSLAEGAVLLGAGIAAVCVGLLFAMHKKAPEAAFCILWIGVTLAPVLNARWMASNVFTERYLYLPSVGFCWLIAWCGIQAWDARAAQAAWLRALLVSGFAAVVIASVAATISRNVVWRNDMGLYTRTLETNPDAAVIRSNRASLYYTVQDYDRAEREWDTALAGKPDNVVTMNALGVLYTERKRYAEAEAMLNRAIAARPLWGTAHCSYAVLLQKEGEPARAMEEFKIAVELSPLDVAARRLYGDALMDQGHLDEAEAQLRKAVELEASQISLHDLADLYLRRGKNQEAEGVLRKLTAENPYDSVAHFQFGRVLEAAGRKDEAVREYQAGLSTDPTNAEAKASLRRLGH